MTLRSQPSEGCASASFATSAHRIRCRTIAMESVLRNQKPAAVKRRRPWRHSRAFGFVMASRTPTQITKASVSR